MADGNGETALSNFNETVSRKIFCRTTGKRGRSPAHSATKKPTLHLLLRTRKKIFGYYMQTCRVTERTYIANHH